MKSHRAFSLLELLVGAGLAVVVASVVLSAFVAGHRWSRRGTEQADFQRMGLYAAAHLMNHLLGARELLHPVLGESAACCFQDHDMRVHVYAFKKSRRVLVHHVIDPESGHEGREHVVASELRNVRFSVDDGARLLHVKLLFAGEADRLKKRDTYLLETALSLRH